MRYVSPAPPRSHALALSLTIVGACCAATASVHAASVEPWSDDDGKDRTLRTPLSEGSDYGFRGGLEYRANALYVNPISLNDDTNYRASWLEHRLRLDAAFDWRDTVRIVTSIDALDGVLWGDNGSYLGSPSSNAGTNVGAKNPNVARPCVGLTGADPLDRRSYAYTLCGQDSVTIRRAYGEVVLPFGVLRIGRQSVNIGSGVQANDGDARTNRFGFSRTGNLVDRILFATKPLEALKSPDQRDRTDTNGLIVALAYDRIVTDSPMLFGDDVHQLDVAARFLAPELSWARDVVASAFYAHRWDAHFNTKIDSLGLRAMGRFGNLHAGFDAVANFGQTREIAEAYRLINNDPVVDQTVRLFGMRGVVRYDRPTWSAYLEGDYASGSADPRVRQPLTQYAFAEDTNVGLLMFKHVLGFQTARASAAAVETLRRLGATTFPAEAINTRGAFANAIAIFPQIDFRPVPELLLRGGILVAWSAAPVIDPVGSLENRTSNDYRKDLVNYVGGRPGRFYGTELDARVQWRPNEHFIVDLEGAVLFPGDAFQDANGDAVRSVLLQARTTFVF